MTPTVVLSHTDGVSLPSAAGRCLTLAALLSQVKIPREIKNQVGALALLLVLSLRKYLISLQLVAYFPRQ